LPPDESGDHSNGLWFFMPGLVPGIHVLKVCVVKDVDGRDKRGHDERAVNASGRWS
jgi:hypothetical protein